MKIAVPALDGAGKPLSAYESVSLGHGCKTGKKGRKGSVMGRPEKLEKFEQGNREEPRSKIQESKAGRTSGLTMRQPDPGGGC